MRILLPWFALSPILWHVAMSVVDQICCFQRLSLRYSNRHPKLSKVRLCFSLKQPFRQSHCFNAAFVSQIHHLQAGSVGEGFRSSSEFVSAGSRNHTGIVPVVPSMLPTMLPNNLLPLHVITFTKHSQRRSRKTALKTALMYLFGKYWTLLTLVTEFP